MELINRNVRSVVYESLRKAGVKSFPFVLCLFLFLLLLNILGLLPYVFPPKTHFVVTLGFSFSIMMAVTFVEVLTFKIEFVSLLEPRGFPLTIAPILVVIETLSFLIKAIKDDNRLPILPCHIVCVHCA